MDRNFFIQKRDFESLQRSHRQTAESLKKTQDINKKLTKKSILYENQYRVFIAELNNKQQELIRSKMLAESTKNMIEKEKTNAKLEILEQIRSLAIQKFSICR